MRQSGVRLFRRPPRAEPRGRDTELAALVADVPGAIYRGAHDADWTMAMITDEIERISGYPASDFVDNACRTFASALASKSGSRSRPPTTPLMRERALTRRVSDKSHDSGHSHE